jgi:hypothetical protein
MKKMSKSEVEKLAASFGVEVKKSWTIAKMTAAVEKERARISGVCRATIANADKYKGCYFWTRTGNASSRRREEFDDSADFTAAGKKYEVRQVLSISCKNYYFSTTVMVDGNKSNITALKKFI